MRNDSIFDFYDGLRWYTIIVAVIVLPGSIYFGWFTALSRESWQTFSKNLFVQLTCIDFAYQSYRAYTTSIPISPVTFLVAGIVTFGLTAFTIPAIRQMKLRWTTQKTSVRIQGQQARTKVIQSYHEM